MAERKRSGTDAQEHWFERFAFISGILGIEPYGCVCLMLYLDPFEQTQLGAHEVMVALPMIAAFSWIPVQLIIIATLPMFFGVRDNLPVLLVRIIGLVANSVLVLALLFALLHYSAAV